MPRRVLNILVENFEVDEDVVVRTAGAHGIRRLARADAASIARSSRIRRSRRARCGARTSPRRSSTRSAIRIYLLHHPFDSFTSVETFLRAAVNDPQVVAIKMTLYRIGQNSPLVDLLIDAAEQGKQVAVLVELKARFDERNNIAWANRLESAGIHVVYGLVNLKTHCKLCLVVRKEADGIRRYAHVGTGNYNARHVADLHRPRAVHRRRAHRRRRRRGVQLPDRLFAPEAAIRSCWWRRSALRQGSRR